MAHKNAKLFGSKSQIKQNLPYTKIDGLLILHNKLLAKGIILNFAANLKGRNQKTMLTADKKKEIFAEFGGSETNTGSVESQVAMITHRINHISGHLKDHRKDHSSTRSLYKLVGQRKKLLKYLAHKDIQRYRDILEKLNLRK